MGLQIVEDIYGFNNGDRMSDLAYDIKDFETEPVAARLPTDMTGSLQFGQARQVDESKVIEWQLMKMRQESLKSVTKNSQSKSSGPAFYKEVPHFEEAS